MLDRLFLGAGDSVATDPNFENVTLLLHGDGSNGKQNNTFLDSSTNNFTITRNGDTTQGSFSPYGDLWSNYFDGTGDYLATPANAALVMGTGQFWFEAWVYMPAAPSSQYIVLGTNDGSLGSALTVRIQPSALRVDRHGVVAYDSSAVTWQYNAWQHIAVGRDAGNTLYFFVNGQAVGTRAGTTDNFAGNSSAIGLIPFDKQPATAFRGYISNARLLKGQCLYTSSFTPPTAPLTAITNTSLLTCQSNRFRDASSNNFTITRNGDVRVTNFAPFNPSAAYDPAVNGGSGYFDGTGDYLAITDNGAFDFGTGDFTVEGWIYRTGSNLSPSIIAGIGPTNGDWMFAINSSTLRWGRNYVAWDAISTTTSNFSGGWFHVVACRASGTLRLFINGAQVYSGANTISYNIANSTLAIGARQLNTGSATPGEFFDGYIANLRVIKGTAVYTAAFTPPTAPITAITNTSLLANFINAGIVDASAKNDLVTVGNAQISTAQSKFGGSSIAFDGTGDWLFSQTSDLFAFGTGNFTIEFWVYLNSVTGNQILYDNRPAQGVYPTIYTNGASLRYYTNSADRITGSNLSTGTWYHVALARSGTSTKLFVNGTQSGSTYTDSNSYLTAPLRIGADYQPSSYLNGYIDDLRITKGVARYTANFTPPTAQFADQ